MHIFIHWMFVLALMLPNAYSVGADDDASTTTVDILFVNDLTYGFYPVDSSGSICKEDGPEEKCKAGLARLVQKLVELNPVPGTTPDSTSSSATTPDSTSSSATTPDSTSSSTTTPTTPVKTPSTTEPTLTKKRESVVGFAVPAVSSNSLLLNVGNTLYSQYNNWFDLLKFAPAVEALESLNFSAIALGPEVLQYGEVMGSHFTFKLKEKLVASNLEVDSNVTSFAEDLLKFQTFNVGVEKNITIIGFMDKTEGELNTNGINITDIVGAIDGVIQKKKAEDNDKHIFIAIGNVGNIEVARNIGRIDGISIVIFSGSVESIEYRDSAYSEELTQETCWIVSTKPPGVNETHHLLGKLSLTLNSTGYIESVNVIAYDYLSTNKTDDDSILKTEKQGQEDLISKKEAPLARSKIALNENEISNENVFGDLVTDAMLEAVQNNNVSVGITIWTPEGKLMKIEAEEYITEEKVHQILGSTRDQNIYAVSIFEKQLRSLLEESVESLGKLNSKIFYTTGLYVEYGNWASKGNKIQKVRTVNSDMSLEELDLTNQNILLRIAVPEYLLKLPYLVDAASPQDLGITMADTVADYIRKYADANKYIKFSPLGLRYLASPPSKKCVDNSAEAVLLTLAVIVMIVALGLIIWYVIIPRIRERRGSTMRLIY